MKKDTVYSWHSFILPFMCVQKQGRVSALFENDLEGNIRENAGINDESNAARVIPFAERKELYREYSNGGEAFSRKRREELLELMQVYFTRGGVDYGLYCV